MPENKIQSKQRIANEKSALKSAKIVSSAWIDLVILFEIDNLRWLIKKGKIITGPH